jgi:hypothetical protein
MKTLSRIDAKLTDLIVAVLSCFDRVIFKGDLPNTRWQWWGSCASRCSSRSCPRRVNPKPMLRLPA